MQKTHPMETGRPRLGVDFGTTSTVVALRDEKNRIRIQDYPGWSHHFLSGTLEHHIPRIPSQILYSNTGTAYFGAAALQEGTDITGITRWLRHYLLENSTVQVPSGYGRMTGYRNAGSDFLIALLSHASGHTNGNREVVFSVPVDAPDQYSAWLREVATTAGFNLPFFIDEGCAAAAGYGLQIVPGSLFLLIDFHQEGLDITIVTPEEASSDTEGLFSRVLGKAHEDTGESLIDGWIVQDILIRNRLDETDSRAARILPLIRNEAARAREKLGTDTETEIQVNDEISGIVLKSPFTTADLKRILENKELFVILNRALDRALSSAGIRGKENDRITAVLMVGEGSAIPCVQDAVRHRWGSKVHCDHPVDAVARGAAAANPDVREPNRIKNDYAIRHWDPVAREYHYRFIVRTGARYPSAGQVARFIISGAYDGQAYLGIPLCELSTTNPDPHGHIELVGNNEGGVRVAGPAPGVMPVMGPVLVNEQEPTLLHASPSAKKGEPRFELTFSLDRKGYLCLTARDLLTGLIVKQDVRVFRLS